MMKLVYSVIDPRSKITIRTIPAKDVEGQGAIELLERVAETGPVKVELSEGTTVLLDPLNGNSESVGELKPFITLRGQVPEGWKDAVYGI